ncbi:MAG TPA: hypothetical protein VGD80_29435 [Kofleriaceae bacterium]
MTASPGRLLAILVAIGALAPHAWAAPRGDKRDKADKEDRDGASDEGGDDDESAKPARKKAGDSADEDGEFKKQDLSGHDQRSTRKENVFERDRFFVDKTDSSKTARGTLVQGSITSTTFGYHESGAPLAAPDPETNPVPSASQFDRLFTDLRLQTDFRHIAAGKWDARIDVRGRVVNDPGHVTPNQGFEPVTKTHVQSGWQGDDELEIKEAWILRNGTRSDVFIGRQFIPDLAGVRIDGLRIDYASSPKFTLLGFGGLYPLRGSRSITTDYSELQSNPANDGTRSSAGMFTGAGGFGAAYRTEEAYGAFGGVALVPFASESPRIFGTSTGYWRSGSKLDFYHFAVLDVVGSNAGLTNLSLGLNYKPDQRLRGTLSFNRVDTETLNVQAQAFLANPDGGINVIQNEAYIQRIANNMARASLSAGLGELQRFEVTAAGAFRYRGAITLTAPPQMMAGAPPVETELPAAKSAELYGAITDRRSVAGLRLGVDGSRVFGVGSTTYQRTSSTAVRASAARELADGHGEWEAEVAYASNKDDNAGVTCAAEIVSCYGASSSTILSLGGNLYYRFNRDWFAMGSVFLNRTSITHIEGTTSTEDPTVTGLSGYVRIAYRF